MDNKIIGFILMVFSLLGTMAQVIFFENLNGFYSIFLSWPSFLIVFGGGTGIILMRKHSYKDNQLGKNLRREFILAGWIGFMIGLVLLFTGFSEEAWVFTSVQKIVYFGSPAIVPVFYGYIGGTILEAFFTKNNSIEKLRTLEERR